MPGSGPGRRRSARREHARRQDRLYRQRRRRANRSCAPRPPTSKRSRSSSAVSLPTSCFANADFATAIDYALFGIFANAGQVCSAGSRASWCSDDIADEFRCGTRPPCGTASSSATASTPQRRWDRSSAACQRGRVEEYMEASAASRGRHPRLRRRAPGRANLGERGNFIVCRRSLRTPIRKCASYAKRSSGPSSSVQTFYG